MVHCIGCTHCFLSKTSKGMIMLNGQITCKSTSPHGHMQHIDILGTIPTKSSKDEHMQKRKIPQILVNDYPFNLMTTLEWLPACLPAFLPPAANSRPQWALPDLAGSRSQSRCRAKCQIQCQKECQNICQKLCQNRRCQWKCQSMCRKECQREWQNRCLCHIYTSKWHIRNYVRIVFHSVDTWRKYSVSRGWHRVAMIALDWKCFIHSQAGEAAWPVVLWHWPLVRWRG